jgi:SHS2 domain-containing protein
VSGSARPAFEFVEGATADLAFVARGEGPGGALRAAAEALLAATVEDPAAVSTRTTRRVVLDAADWDLLLLRLLNELVYLRDAEGLLLRVAEARTDAAGGRVHLEAELAGEPWSLDRHRPAAEVKAATAHGLALRPVEGADGRDGAWEARATLDV